MYSILDSDDDGSQFTIEETTGAVFSGFNLDREKKSHFVFTVRASDLGEFPRTSDVKVFVTVEDFNDRSPEFTQVRG